MTILQEKRISGDESQCDFFKLLYLIISEISWRFLKERITFREEKTRYYTDRKRTYSRIMRILEARLKTPRKFSRLFTPSNVSSEPQKSFKHLAGYRIKKYAVDIQNLSVNLSVKG